MILSLAQWERDRELRPAFSTIFGCHSSSVHPDDRLNERKSKSVPARRASFDSSLEKVATNFHVEARAVIFDGKCAHIVCRLKRQPDGARCRQMLEFVVEQVGNHAMKKGRVGKYFDWASAPNVNR